MTDTGQIPYPRILTNMRFFQSAAWNRHARSLYGDPAAQAQARPLGAWREAVRLWIHAGAYDVVVTEGARTSLLYGLLCMGTARRSKHVMAEVFLDSAQSGHPFRRVKNAAFQRVARRSYGILTNSSAEVGLIAKRYRMPEEKLRFVTMHSNIRQPEYHPPVRRAVFSAGRSHRDFQTLETAAPGIHAPVEIAGAVDPSAPPPPNVIRLADLPYADYLERMKTAAVIAVPLRPAPRSTGQVVLLEAMGLGKPVVATRAAGTADIVRDGETGLLTPPGNPEALRRAVNQLLDDPRRAEQIGRAAAAWTAAHATFDHHAEHKLNAIRELLQVRRM